MSSLFLPAGQAASVTPGLSFEGPDGPASLDLTFRTAPGHQSGAAVSQETALDLAHRIILQLERMGAPISKPCEIDGCGRPTDTAPQLNSETGLLEWSCFYCRD